MGTEAQTTSATAMPADLHGFEESYVALFGALPPLPAAKFAFGAGVDPEALRLAERFRQDAFYSDVFDVKTTQLLCFAMLLATGDGAARWHAMACRKAGASWRELFKVAELASAVASLGPLNNGGSILKGVRDDEGAGTAPDGKDGR